jgi:hypothetical protein
VLVQSAQARSAAPVDVVERVLEPADREQNRDARDGALDVGVAQSIEDAVSRRPVSSRESERSRLSCPAW